jgi:hypothetical protein
MTIIAALHDPALGTWVGSDSQATCGGIRYTLGMKWIFHETAAIGVAGNWLTYNIVERHKEEIFEAGCAFDIAQFLRQKLLEHGFKPEEKSGEAENIFSYSIYATPSEVWDFSPDGAAVQSPPLQLCVSGSGGDTALGADRGLCIGARWSGATVTAESRMCAAMMAAIDLEVYCSGPINLRLLPLPHKKRSEAPKNSPAFKLGPPPLIVY